MRICRLLLICLILWNDNWVCVLRLVGVVRLNMLVVLVFSRFGVRYISNLLMYCLCSSELFSLWLVLMCSLLMLCVLSVVSIVGRLILLCVFVSGMIFVLCDFSMFVCSLFVVLSWL